jgi:hypothetical protein
MICELESPAVDVLDLDPGVAGEALAELGDVDVHAPGDEIALRSPDHPHGRVPFQDLVHVPDQDLEEVSFFRDPGDRLHSTKGKLDRRP